MTGKGILERSYITTDPKIKTAKAVREQWHDMGSDDWQDMDRADVVDYRVSKVEKVVYSPCSLILTHMTPPAHWTKESHPQIRYLSSSTAFDEQPEGTFMERIHRKYSLCNTYIEGKTSQVCNSCMRKIQDGWSVIHPLKKEESE